MKKPLLISYHKSIYILYKPFYYRFQAFALSCFVGKGDINEVNYVMKDCNGSFPACLKWEDKEGTVRACGYSEDLDECYGDSCVCTTTLCNRSTHLMNSKKSQFAFFLFNFTFAILVPRLI